jgi:hypothetical protein
MKSNTMKVIYTLIVAGALVALIMALAHCDGVQIYDPPMVPNSAGRACTSNGQCPFPTLCSRYSTNDTTGVCR